MINGIINVYKEKGYTSHDVVAKLRGILKQKKIGHTGTLDPDAVGVLPVCLGKATKLCDLLTDKDKTYEAVLLLGIETDTQDISGKILNESTVNLTKKMIETAIKKYIGEYSQIPPMYSALKVNGKKLYELAREGKTIERTPRQVYIKDIIINDINLPANEITMTIDCSKGTYIRTLCHDIGSDLGCGGCMKSLIRTKVSRFSIDDGLTLSKIQQLMESNNILEYILPIDEMFQTYPKITVLESGNKYLYNGNQIKSEYIFNHNEKTESGSFRLYDSNQIFIGIYEFIKDEDIYKPIKLFIS